MDPELAQILKLAPGPPPDWTDLNQFLQSAKARQAKVLEDLQAPVPGVRESEIFYPTRDSTKLRAKLYQPIIKPSGGSPLILLFHGGGFCTGMPEGESQTARNLTRAFSAVCVSASYRLAPEFPFPYAPNDAWDALKWVASNAGSLDADTAQGFIVGGSSAGANLATMVAHMARDTGLQPSLTGQFLAAPMICGGKTMPQKYQDQYTSWSENANAPVMPVAAVDMFMRGYSPDEQDGKRFAILAHPGGHSNLPPAYIAVSDLDPLRDHGLIYERVLRDECGIRTRLDRYPGVPHAHWAFLPLLKQSRRYRQDQIAAFAWLLDKSPVKLDDVDDAIETVA